MKGYLKVQDAAKYGVEVTIGDRRYGGGNFWNSNGGWPTAVWNKNRVVFARRLLNNQATFDFRYEAGYQE